MMQAHASDRIAGGAACGWLRGRERGQSLVELSLAVPVLCVILFAIVEFGLITGDQTVIDHAASDGARVGARGDSSTQATYAQTEATNEANTTSVKQCGTPAATVTYDSANSGTITIPDYVHVTVSCTYTPLTPLGTLVAFLGHSLNLNQTLSSTYSMRVQ
jgi:Flp pilus assembly protein TadG